MTRPVSGAGLCLLALLALSTGGGARADEESDWRALQESNRLNVWVPFKEDKLRHIRLFSKIEEGKRLRSMKAEVKMRKKSGLDK